jgi:hypothetical protein
VGACMYCDRLKMAKISHWEHLRTEELRRRTALPKGASDGHQSPAIDAVVFTGAWNGRASGKFLKSGLRVH